MMMPSMGSDWKTEQVVELLPVGFGPELPQCPCQDRAPPQDGVILVVQNQVGADDLDVAGCLDGHDQVAHAHGVDAGEAEHAWDRGAGDVGVQDADAVSLLGELGSDHAADQGLADATLAGDDADHALDRAVLVQVEGGRFLLLLRGLCALPGGLELPPDGLFLFWSHLLPLTSGWTSCTASMILPIFRRSIRRRETNRSVSRPHYTFRAS